MNELITYECTWGTYLLPRRIQLPPVSVARIGTLDVVWCTRPHLFILTWCAYRSETVRYKSQWKWEIDQKIKRGNGGEILGYQLDRRFLFLRESAHDLACHRLYGGEQPPQPCHNCLCRSLLQDLSCSRWQVSSYLPISQESLDS